MIQQTSHSVGLTFRLIGVISLLSIVVSPLLTRAADPAFVGSLAIAADAKTAAQLGLSDEVRQKLIALIERRENEAVNLALSIKDLPPDQRQQRLAPFVAESERLGLELLTMEQRSKLNQIRVRQGGMATLADPSIAQVLSLTDEQKQQVGTLLNERALAMRQGGERERRIAHDVFERKLRKLLTDTQLANWDRMAGLGPGITPTTAAADSSKPAADATPATPTTAAADSSKPAADAAAAPAREPGTAGPETATTATSPKPTASAAAPKMKTTAADVAAKSEQTAPAQPAAAATAKPSAVAASAKPQTGPVVKPDEVKLRFNFKFQPWKDVLDWLAEQADLSLQSDLVPEGTFNYSDPREFTPDQAIDLINGVLLTKGYTLVRRGRILNVLNLTDEVPDTLVEYVPVEDLDNRGQYELVKTVFHLAKMEPADAEAEVGKLLGPGRSMVVMPKARQLLVIETAGKLREIRDVLKQAENPDNGMNQQLTELKLVHVTPQEVLAIARPLLGLGEEENVGEGISIAIDTLGTRLFATGTPEKVAMLQSVVKSVDESAGNIAPGANPALEQLQLMTHPITTADPNEVLAVLQTLLAGSPDVRLSLDTVTNKIVALARPSEHQTITATIKQMEGDSPELEVIQLRRVDPQLAVLTINNFFAGAADGASSVKVDADPTTMKLYVRAKRSQINEVKKLLEQLEGPAENSAIGGNLRFIPLAGNTAQSAVEMAERLWTGENKIRLSGPVGGNDSSLLELREVSPEQGDKTGEPNERTMPQRPLMRRGPMTPRSRPLQAAPQTAPQAAPPTVPSRPAADTKQVAPERVTADDVATVVPVQFVSDQIPANQSSGAKETPAAGAAAAPATLPGTGNSKPGTSAKGSDIRVEVTPSGIVIASEDTAALDRFEELLRTVMGPQNVISNKTFTVYFLKYAKADVAQQLIQDIMGGSSSSGGSSLIGDVASNLMGGGGGLMGALLGGGGGGGGGDGVTTIQGLGTVSIVADARLNCLIVQAVPADRQMIEELLKVVDRESSITDIYTQGKPFIIPVNHVSADEVANVVKEAFADRMATNTSQGGRGGQPNPLELIRALRGGSRGRGGTEVTSEAPKMKLTVDARSNSLILIAPDALYQEVKSLVEQIDQASADLAEDVQVVTLKQTNPEAVQKAVASILQASGSSSNRRSSSSSSSTPSRSPFPGFMPGGMSGFSRGGFTPGMMGRPSSSGSSGRPSLGGSSGRPSFGGSSGRPSFGGSSGRPSSSRGSSGRPSSSRGSSSRSRGGR